MLQWAEEEHLMGRKLGQYRHTFQGKLLRYQPNRWLMWCLAIGWLMLACRLPFDFVQVSGGVLFQDDFSKPYKGWQRISSPQTSSNFMDGVYRLTVNAPNIHTLRTPGLYFQDVQVEVDAQKVSGSDRNLFGLICRYQDEGHYYALLVSSDGYYGIFANVDGKFGLLGVELMNATDALHPSPMVNHLRADCIHDRLAMWVNGIPLGEVRDTSFRQGDVGLFAGTFAVDGTEIWFDNLSVVKP
jgi:hypothetical protein